MTKKNLFTPLFILCITILALSITRLARIPTPIAKTTIPAINQKITNHINTKYPNQTRFLCLGDIHSVTSTYPTLKKLAKKYNVDFILLLGDIVRQAHPDYYHHISLHLKKLSQTCPVFALPGNHDLQFNPDLFEKYIGPKNFTIQSDTLKIICLDNNEGLDKQTYQTIHQNQSDKPTLLACHKPIKEKQAKTLKPKINNLKAFFWGHQHKGYQQFIVDQIPVWEIPGGGGHIGPEKTPFLALVEHSPKTLRVTKISFNNRHSFWYRLQYWWDTKSPFAFTAITLSTTGVLLLLTQNFKTLPMISNLFTDNH